jgi:phage/plasmid-like protein (TIGR03299 family)
MENVIEKNEQLLNHVLDIMNKYKLNWDVNKIPLFTNEEGGSLPTNSFGIFRSDNNAWLSTQGKNYVPLQNFDLVSSVITASTNIKEFDLNAVHAGQLSQGRKIYVQLPMEDEVIGNSKVNRWITALNSHDGSSCVAFGSQQTVVICQNTFYMAYKNLTHVRHNMNAKDKLMAMATDLNNSLMEDQLLTEEFKRWVDMPVTSRQIEMVKNGIVALNEDKEEKLSMRKQNQLIKIDRAIEQEFSLEGENLWGLFNGVTRYTNHTMSPNKTQVDIKESLMVGQGARINKSAYNQIHAFANFN